MLLDDVLSAVDASVGAHLWEHCVKGVMGGKTRVMVTHALQYLPECDLVLVMDGGKIVERGTYEDLMADAGKAPVLAGLVNTYADNKAGLEAKVAAAAVDTSESGSGSGSDSGEDEADKKSGSESGNDSGDEAADKEEPESSGNKKELTGEEKRGEGSVKFNTLMKYFRAAGLPHTIALVGLFVVEVIADAVANYWLAWWADNRFGQTAFWYMRRYAGISLVQVAVTLSRQILRSVSSVRASRIIHEAMLQAVRPCSRP